MNLNRRSALRYGTGAAALAVVGAVQPGIALGATPKQPLAAAGTADVPDPVQVFQQFVAASLANDPQALADLYAVDTVVEIAFAPPGVPTVTNGRAALLARFQGSVGILTFSSIDSIVIHQTTDPTVIVTEYQVHGNVVATGDAFDFIYSSVMTICGGEIVHSRDYSNPLAGAEALGQLPALFTALTGQQCG